MRDYDDDFDYRDDYKDRYDDRRDGYDDRDYRDDYDDDYRDDYDDGYRDDYDDYEDGYNSYKSYDSYDSYDSYNNHDTRDRRDSRDYPRDRPAPTSAPRSQPARRAPRPAPEPQQRRKPARKEPAYIENDDYETFDEHHTSQSRQQLMNNAGNFRKRHPVLMNLIYIIVASVLLIWMLLWFIDFWTFHGEERVVPDVKGQTFESAEGNVDLSGLKAVISDSVFDSYSRPGTVVEQTPIAGARIKKGGTVYLTIVAFSPKLITVPDFYNVSVRQARSMFNGLGISEVREVPVISEYQGLVLGAKFNGVSLQPGARIPVSAVVTLEVGSGYEDFSDTADEVTDTLAIDETIEELNIE